MESTSSLERKRKQTRTCISFVFDKGVVGNGVYNGLGSVYVLTILSFLLSIWVYLTLRLKVSMHSTDLIQSHLLVNLNSFFSNIISVATV